MYSCEKSEMSFSLTWPRWWSQPNWRYTVWCGRASRKLSSVVSLPSAKRLHPSRKNGPVGASGTEFGSFLSHGGTPLIIHFYRMFHEPSISDTTYLWNPQNLSLLFFYTPGLVSNGISLGALGIICWYSIGWQVVPHFWFSVKLYDFLQTSFPSSQFWADILSVQLCFLMVWLQFCMLIVW